jgi:hypothetical protein
LLLYILFSTVVPCSVFDNCGQEEHTGQASHTDHTKDCNGCSPFSICSAAHGFTISSNMPSVKPLQWHSSPAYGELYLSFTSAYYSSYFQPPRFG